MPRFVCQLEIGAIQKTFIIAKIRISKITRGTKAFGLQAKTQAETADGLKIIVRSVMGNINDRYFLIS